MRNFSGRILLLMGSLALMTTPTHAQFGLGMIKQKQEHSQKEADFDLSDEELLEAIQELGGMSAEEKEEFMKELVEMLGDDPETLSAIQDVMREIPNYQVTDMKSAMNDMMKSAMNDMVSQDEVVAATKDALKMLEGSKWETIWEKQEVILDAVIQSGQISANDAALFKSDKVAWEKELGFIWNELQKQAADAAKGGLGQEEIEL